MIRSEGQKIKCPPKTRGSSRSGRGRIRHRVIRSEGRKIKCPPKTRGSSRSGRGRIRHRMIRSEGQKIKCPESQGGALGAGEAEPGEGFDLVGSLREVSEPGRRCVRPKR